MSTEENALEVSRGGILSLFDSIGHGMNFTNLDQARVWAEVREEFDPKGENLPAAELVDRPFTIKKIKPVKSAYPNGPDHFYFIVGIDQDGTVFNTAMGGVAVVEELDGWMRANYNWMVAVDANDENEAQFWASQGGGQPITVTLRENEGGEFGHYYTLD